MRISDWSSDVCSSDLIFGEARIDEHRLAFRHDNARLGIDQFRQRVKIVLVIDEVVRAIERVLDGSKGVHAASARRARPSSEATIVSTSRIRAPRPSPNILVPATPGIYWKLVSRLLIKTSRCSFITSH